MSMNSWVFSGRVGADAELKTTEGGRKLLSFRVANDIGFGASKSTQWVDCSWWGQRAEAVANYIKKGDKITVAGEVKLQEFQRRDGTPGAKLAVRVNDVDLAGRHEGEGGSERSTPSASSRSASDGGRSGSSSRAPQKPAYDEDLDDTIPF